MRIIKWILEVLFLIRLELNTLFSTKTIGTQNSQQLRFKKSVEANKKILE